MGYASFFEDIERERTENARRGRHDIDAHVGRAGAPSVRDWPALLAILDEIHEVLERSAGSTEHRELNRVRSELLEKASRVSAMCSFKVQCLEWVEPLINSLEPLVRLHVTSAQRAQSLLQDIGRRRRALRELWSAFEKSYRESTAARFTRNPPAELARLDLTDFQRSALKASGVARVVGGAGTGKTLVLLHRALDIAMRKPEEHVCVVAPTHTLAVALEQLAKQVVPREIPNIRFRAMYRVAYEIVRSLNPGSLLGLEFSHGTTLRSDRVGSDEEWRDFKYSRGWKNTPAHDATAIFTRSEFTALLDDDGSSEPDSYLRQELAFIRSLRPSGDLLETYLECKRTGRVKRLERSQRNLYWAVLQQWESFLRGGGLIEPETLVQQAAALVENDESVKRLPSELRPDHILVDEYQDLSTADLYVLWRVRQERENPGGFILTGDLLQGTRVRHISYLNVDESLARSRQIYRLQQVLRCTEEIRATCRQMLAPHRKALEESGNWDDDFAQVFEESASPFHGPKPELRVFARQEEQSQYLLREIMAALMSGRRVGVGCATSGSRDALIGFLRGGGVAAEALRRDHELALQPESTTDSSCVIGTFADLKGQEFDEVFLFDVSNTWSQTTDDGEWRNLLLLYVAMTRARERLTMTCTGAPSPFLANVLVPVFDDLGSLP